MSPTTGSSSSKVRSMIRGLHPEYFAMSMATGAVFIACHLIGFSFFDWPFLIINAIIYVALWALTIARIILYPDRIRSDLNDYKRAFGFFTIPAATCILGDQVATVAGRFGVAAGLLILGVTLWWVLLYTIFTLMTVGEGKPPIGKGIGAAWLLSTVATQMVAILTARISSYFTDYQQILLFSSLCMFFLGGTLYSIIVTLLFYRLMFFDVKPQSLSSSYWITMGAEATTVIAGMTLLLHGSGSHVVSSLYWVILGISILFWATASWWIPFLLLLGLWRYIVRRVKLSYNPLLWGMVYPLGTYTYCTLRLTDTAEVQVVSIISHIFVYAALVAWFLTFAGYLWSLATSLASDS